MEADFREVVLRHCQDELRVGKENVATVAVDSHKLVLTLLESLEGGSVVALNPASLIH